MTADTCSCARCGSTFVDQLAYAAHRQWVSREKRGPCKFPRSMLYRSGDSWALRPSFREAVERTEYGPADEFRISVRPKAEKRQGGESAETTPSVYAGSRGAS